MRLVARERPVDDVADGAMSLPPESKAEATALARQVAAEVADAVDADQWAIAVVGVSGTGAPDFEELIPRPYLEALNDGPPARYRITLVLQADGRDLGILRLGTLRPNGFSDDEIARARAAAAQAAVTLAEVLHPAATRPSPASPTEPDRRQGVVILDANGCIRVVSPVGEQLLGWRSSDVAGKSCASVLACQDARGCSLCGGCGFAVALDRQEIIPPTRMWIAAPTGSRRVVRAAFWYLPPAGRIYEPRVMLVVAPDLRPTLPRSGHQRDGSHADAEYREHEERAGQADE